jgi:hypothetical protein
MDLKCFSHTLAHVGEEVKLPNLKVVKEKLCGLMNAGGGVGQIHEVWRQTFGSYGAILEELDGGPPSSCLNFSTIIGIHS